MNNINFLESIKQKIGGPTSMIRMEHYDIIVIELLNCLLSNTEGDVVELGCNIGNTSLLLQSCLNQFGSNKLLHVYDSFEGLPAKHLKDVSTNEDNRKKFIEGQLKVSVENLINNFKQKQINLPQIHTGWFKDIPEEEYPAKICFAFLDGDFYTSILDSLHRIYDKMSPGGIIIIHDYGWSPLPGVKLACEEFLKDKPEKVLQDYFKNHIGKIIKQY